LVHWKQIREFILTDKGVQLADVSVGTDGVLTGSARAAQQVREQAELHQRQRVLEQTRRKLARFEALHREQQAKLEAEFDAEAGELRIAIESMLQADAQVKQARAAMAAARQAEQQEGNP